MIDGISSFISSRPYFFQSPSGAVDGLCSLRLLLLPTDWLVIGSEPSSQRYLRSAKRLRWDLGEADAGGERTTAMQI